MTEATIVKPIIQDCMSQLTEARVMAYAKNHQFKLTPAYLQFLLRYNGGSFKQNVCAFVAGTRIDSPAVCYFLGIADYSWERTFDIGSSLAVFRDQRGLPGVPIAGDDFGNYFFLDTDRDCVFFWDHEKIDEHREQLSRTTVWLDSFEYQEEIQFVETDPLFRAVEMGNVAAVERQMRPDSLKSRNNKGRSLLQVAVASGQRESTRYLLKHGADVEYGGDDRPIFYAAARGYKDICQLLVSAGASLEVRDSEDETPLMCAVRGGQLLSAAELIRTGADVSTRNSHGRTIREVAEENRNGRYIDEMISILR